LLYNKVNVVRSLAILLCGPLYTQLGLALF